MTNTKYESEAITTDHTEASEDDKGVLQKTLHTKMR